MIWVNLPLTLEKSKSFRSIDGEGRTLSGPFIEWLEKCWLWLLLFKPLLFMLSLWWLDFSLDEIGEGETFEFELAFEFDEFNSSALLWCSLFAVLCTGVFEFGRESGASAMGLRRISLWRIELGGDPVSSFFGVLGRVKANACVWNEERKIRNYWHRYSPTTLNWTWCTREWFHECSAS